MSQVELPERYAVDYHQPVLDAIAGLLVPGASVLDIGAGRRPVVSREDRPADVTYVGLDISADELALAGDGYDETHAADMCEHLPELDERFDLAVCFQVLEHVHDLPAAVENARRYLKPGGTFVAQLSGGRAAQAFLMRALPLRASQFLAEKLLKFPPDEVFPAFYDKCTASGLRESMREWSSVEITPRWIGATYFNFAKPLLRGALKYEEWAMNGHRDDLAPYYVIVGRR